MADFRLQIVTQQSTVFDKNVTALTLPAEDGYFGVLAHHAPIIAVLKEGKVDIREGNVTRSFTITGGFFEMENNRASLLADSLSGLDRPETD